MVPEEGSESLTPAAKGPNSDQQLCPRQCPSASSCLPQFPQHEDVTAELGRDLLLCRILVHKGRAGGHCKKGMKLLRVWSAGGEAQSVPQLLGRSHLLAAMTCEMDFPALSVRS